MIIVTRRRLTFLAIWTALLLCACNNTYGPPGADGKPRNWGQQHYLDNQRYQESVEQGRND